ncbi:MAG: ribbon-helix-helix domain-containing protein [Nanoarchaeota archaeon]
MESVTIKLESDFLKALERTMKKHRYMTKTEFIRQAMRDKMNELEKEETLKNVEKLFGSSKHKTTDEQLHEAGERAVRILEKKFRT